jgi:hypothetical protein
MGVVVLMTHGLEIARYSSERGPHDAARVSMTEGPPGRRPYLWIEAKGLSIRIAGNTFWNVFEQLCHHDKVAELIKPEYLTIIREKAHEHGTSI